MRFHCSPLPDQRRKSWERAKVGLQRVDGECRIDLSELSQMPLEVDMNDMDHGRTLKNRGGEVRLEGLGKGKKNPTDSAILSIPASILHTRPRSFVRRRSCIVGL